MAQHDYTIANQGFPATRSDLNNVLQAIATNNTGTSAPTTLYAGQFWIDTTATTWVLYIHDGTDNIQFAQIDTSANTVNFIDTALANDVVINTSGNITTTGAFTSKGIDDNADALAMTIGSNENIGIGTTNVTTAKVYIDHTGDVDDNGLYVYSNIGQTVPLARILQDGAGSNVPAVFVRNDGSAGGIIIEKGGSGATANTGHNQVIIDGSSNSGMSILSGASSNGAICFGDSGNNCVGYVNYAHNGNHLDFGVNGSEVARFDSSGNFGIGTSSPDTKIELAGQNSGGASNVLRFTDTDTGTTANQKFGAIQFNSSDSGNTGTGGAIDAISEDFDANTAIRILTGAPGSASERLRITSGGAVLVSNTSEPSSGDNGAQISNGSYHIFCRNTSSALVFWAFGSSGEFRTLGNGNAQNTNNSYGAISDRVLKENEVDASSQWNDIKSLQIKNYNFKSKPNEKQLGVIAQDLEASGMNGLVENNQDELYTEDDVLPEGKNIGDVKLKNYKSVKYSILYMKSVKALQEAMERIETLEAKVTELENA